MLPSPGNSSITNVQVLTMETKMASFSGQVSWAKMTSPGAKVTKLITTVIYCHSMVLLSFCVINSFTPVVTIEWQNITMGKSFITLAHVGKLKCHSNIP